MLVLLSRRGMLWWKHRNPNDSDSKKKINSNETQEMNIQTSTGQKTQMVAYYSTTV